MVESMIIPGQGYSRSVSDLRSFSTKIHRLPHLFIELTDRCNNNCQHCYINRPAKDLQAVALEMKTDFIKNLILQAADLGCLDLRFTGGEPLLRDDFQELFCFSRKLGFHVFLSTNARLITPELANLFKRLPPGQPIGITVYGMSEETYDNVSRTQGSYNEFRRGVSLLEENYIDFALRMAVLPDNRRDVPAYEDWIRNLFHGKQKPAFIVNFSQRARPDDPEKNLNIQEIRGQPEETVDFIAQTNHYSTELHDFCRQFTGLKSEKLFECGFGRSISVDAYGFAQGCLLLRHPDLLYDLHTGSLAEALCSFFPKFSDRRAKNPLFLSRCAHCCLRGLCEQCPAQSWMEHGTLDTPVEFLCRIAHAHARKLGLLSSGENGWEITDWPSRLDHG
jgi:MoaA/NifB/PqqE/SkfB family radical SAM enzyme